MPIRHISTEGSYMRQPEEVKREIVRQWLNRAEEDFYVADHLFTGKTPYLRAIGFHAQQAAEKFLKALLVHYQIEFPKTHDLAELLDLVASVDTSIAERLNDAMALNPYGVEMRYPSDFPEMSQEEAGTAVELATRVRKAVSSALKEYT